MSIIFIHPPQFTKMRILLLLLCIVLWKNPSPVEASSLGGIKSHHFRFNSQPHGKICIGTKGRMSVPNNREHHYRNLRDRYTNCTYVDGNLELTWLQDENLDLSFLQHIREVTGYVLISHVDVRKKSVRDDKFSLMVTLSKMHYLEMPALRDILEGSVGILNNYNLCHIKTIEWEEIITGPRGKYVYVYNFNEPERDCTPCHESCQSGCWGEGPSNCQKFSKINCSPQCHKGRCFGELPRECCHLFCAGGCTGPKQSDCLACRNFFDDGNPEGKYAYGATCVKECPKHLLKDNGACVRICPPKKKTVNGECVPCDGPCPKTCHFNEVMHAGNIDSFQNCTKSMKTILLEIDILQWIQRNWKFFTTLKEVTGYINIQGHHPNFKNLNAFRNLEVIGALLIILFCKNNKNPQECIRQDHMCDPQCSAEGCWGPGNNSCLSCKKFQVDSECISSCDPNLGLYKVKENKCMKCHKECDLTCKGPGPGNCDKCKHTKDGPFCVSHCPDGKYHNSSFGTCKPCHENCVGGCDGPGNTIGPRGCKSCEKAIVSNLGNILQCLEKDEHCPEAHFEEWVVRQTQGKLEPLAGKAICRPCHSLCKKCNGYGFHDDVCQECVHFSQDQQCVPECDGDYYKDSTKCKPCSEECRGCYGMGPDKCLACKNYKVYLTGEFPGNINSSTAPFNCTHTCPKERPNKILPEEGDADPFCSAEALHLGRTLTAQNSIPAIIGGLVGSKLKIVREAELRCGGILGYGAFGTVYKGVWVPEGENVKIPVAVKVLREGTGSNANKEILEEAYIMASVEHPNLLQLLAVCMTSQMMLVTQLMPLGCLLDYVRNNKDKIGSKPLLNWCTQIARGMAHLEERRLVHRDLAARNVLVQTPSCVKITDFGLAKLLDINEDEYKAAGGKMPIKWLALECIQHRIFTHKSDVWAFGVTVWELLTYGGRPYEKHSRTGRTRLTGKGRKILNVEPLFKELGEEFAKMAQDPGRYLVIPGDKLMRLPSYTTQDERELIRNLSSNIGGSKVVMGAEEYFKSCTRTIYANRNTVPPVALTMVFSTLGSRSCRFGSNFFSSSCDPLKLLEDDNVDSMPNPSTSTLQHNNSHKSTLPLGSTSNVNSNNTLSRRQVNGLRLNLPMDDEEYLVPLSAFPSFCSGGSTTEQYHSQ
ncbi:EGFR [Lepeophtheirus salmonis]|uniref:receptor protein-tyrosine kinase n=1 Tax=Lepeophtheirus salmonis TaxID=72036 RepID=A0A7R8CT36_LEPSM|nr:EGFR [Lepeophtheirus salmonis]CAF2885167.1 EGFR [Lepeophtheirus salmonis]